MIKITEDYAVESDGKCVTLYKRRVYGEKSKTPGQETWDILGYFNDYIQAGIRVLDYSVVGAESFEFMVERMNEVKKEIIEVLGGKK